MHQGQIQPSGTGCKFKMLPKLPQKHEILEMFVLKGV